MRSVLRSFAALLVGLIALGAAGQVSASEERDDLAVIKERGVVRVAMTHSPPDFVKDVATGGWSGPFAELYRAMFAMIDVEVEFVDTPWRAVVPSLQSRGVDVAALSLFPARSDAIDNTEPFRFVPMGMLLPDGEEETVTWDSVDRENLRVAVMDGAIHERLLGNVAPNATVVTGQDHNEAILLLETGRADAVVAHYTALRSYVDARGRGVALVPDPAVGLVTTLVLRKGNPDLKRFLQNSLDFLSANGTMRAIFRQTGSAEFLID